MGRPRADLNHRAAARDPRTAGVGAAIRVLSCNLWGGRAASGALREILEERQVDLVCAQELDEALAKTLTCALPEGLLAPDSLGRGLGIASHRPVAVTPLDLGSRDGLIANLSPSEWPQLKRPIQIVNVHILAPHTWPYFPRRERRSVQVARLLETLAADPSIPRALVGDFNATPWWPAYRAIASRYRDAVASLSARPLRTWPNLNRFGLPGLLRIDHCFVSGLRAVRAERVPLRGSDHYGLCVDLVETDG